MRRLLLAASLLLSSCSVIHTTSVVSPAPQPPVIEDYCDTDGGCDYRHYADDLNWYMIYIFTYTKAVNEYAVSNGWTPPKAPPVCRLIKWPKPEQFPDFEPKRFHGNIHDFEWQLTQYIKKLRRIYTDHIDDIDDAEVLQKTLCTY